MIHIVICDDEPSYQEIIAYKIQQCLHNQFEMECKLTCCDTLNDLKIYLENNRVDIVFLDIMVQGENAMDWSVHNITDKYIQLIFMTGFPECAYNLSETNCCYYIIKSRLTEEILTKALRRALQNRTKKDPALTIIKAGSKNYVINEQDILYIESLNNTITLHLKDSSNYTIYTTLKKYAEQLPPNFLRCHKSYLVNMNRITAYEAHKFIVDSGKAIPISPKRYSSIIHCYRKYLDNTQ